ncbi:ATP-dependent 6-phosphofructokinase [Azospirillum sp. SYSU D00513]|uniref:ATP-dependent 6-phosphofructokinase n=1 Tax=Azospirillum sp. SYSU D00513 TaxID=2812561 RepID=UPI001A974484|nr:ATP-dependent 6-phosphofructokinase [Azospirillum sp. SYSU D00513]
MAAKKRIGILTSGGDCAGLNAVIRSVVHRAAGQGWEVLGIREGTQGLLDRPARTQALDLQTVDGAMMRQGGTILGTTNRGDPFAYPMPDGSVKDRSDEIIAGYRELGLDALIGIGGDGSFAILRKLAQKGGINLVGVPKTIDNDLGATELSVGFDTAVGVAVEALDRLQPTAASHQRVMVLEVMGRDAGHIALAAGIAGGADVILIPEVSYSVERIAAKIQEVRSTGRNFALVVVSEAVRTLEGSGIKKALQGGEKRYGGIGDYIGELIADATGAETRVTVLGHVQRGSPPSPRDRLVASAFGVHAVDLIAEGRFDRMVAWSNRGVIDVPIEEAIRKYACVELDSALVRTARGLGISLGD